MTNSLAFPNMFDAVRGTVSILQDNASIVNRSRLLILSEPTSLYNEPNFGVGLSRHLWQYNTENERAIIKDRIKEQLRLHEPCCDADATQFANGLLFTEGADAVQDPNHLKMTVAIKTIFGDNVSLDVE